jgi:hypothetical protein
MDNFVAESLLPPNIKMCCFSFVIWERHGKIAGKNSSENIVPTVNI